MVLAFICSLTLLAAAAEDASPKARSYPSPAAAVEALLASKPRVVSFGEYHQQKRTAKITSSLRRFTSQILPSLSSAGATDLVVETWITTGTCGEEERAAVADVEEKTQRPATTENELVTMLRTAKGAGILPRILEVKCQDYRALFSGKDVDYDRLLRLTRDQLEIQIRNALGRQGSQLVLSYGGALHNDRYPSEELAAYAFGPAIADAVDGKYLEIDLYVPEYIDKDASIKREPWYQEYRRAARPGKVIVVERGPGSFVLVFPRSR